MLSSKSPPWPWVLLAIPQSALVTLVYRMDTLPNWQWRHKGVWHIPDTAPFPSVFLAKQRPLEAMLASKSV